MKQGAVFAAAIAQRLWFMPRFKQWRYLLVSSALMGVLLHGAANGSIVEAERIGPVARTGVFKHKFAPARCESARSGLD